MPIVVNEKKLKTKRPTFSTSAKNIEREAGRFQRNNWNRLEVFGYFFFNEKK